MCDIKWIILCRISRMPFRLNRFELKISESFNPFRVPWSRCHRGEHRFWPYLHRRPQRFLRACILCCACCVFLATLCTWLYYTWHNGNGNGNYRRLPLRLVCHINRQRAANKCCRLGSYIKRTHCSRVCVCVIHTFWQTHTHTHTAVALSEKDAVCIFCIFGVCHAFGGVSWLSK